MAHRYFKVVLVFEGYTRLKSVLYGREINMFLTLVSNQKAQYCRLLLDWFRIKR